MLSVLKIVNFNDQGLPIEWLDPPGGQSRISKMEILVAGFSYFWVSGN